nr:hypothetical protein [Tanacetum cinerariifolium]
MQMTRAAAAVVVVPLVLVAKKMVVVVVVQVVWRLKSSSGKGLEFDALLRNFGGNEQKLNGVKKPVIIKTTGLNTTNSFEPVTIKTV